LTKGAEEEEEAEERVIEDEKDVETDEGKVEPEVVEDDKAKAKESKLDDKLEIEVINEEEEVNDESVEDTEMLDKDNDEVENMSLNEKENMSTVKIADGEEQGSLLEETDGSTESEIPVDLDYAADSGILQPLQIVSAKIQIKTDVKERETQWKVPATIADDFEHNTENMEAVDHEEVSDQDKDKGAQAKSRDVDEKKTEANVDPQEPKSSPGFQLDSEPAGKEEEKSKNDSGSYNEGKTKKQKKNKRARKHSPQTEETESVPAAICLPSRSCSLPGH